MQQEEPINVRARRVRSWCWRSPACSRNWLAGSARADDGLARSAPGGALAAASRVQVNAAPERLWALHDDGLRLHDGK